jgi:hypothetical protein
VTDGKMPLMKRKLLIGIFLLLALVFGVFYNQSQEFDSHEGALADRTVYTFNPYTILDSLDIENSDVFIPAPAEPDEGWPLIASPGTFKWDESDYLRVANALHQRVWGESLDNWKLIYADFDILQCTDIVDNVDDVAISFYRRENGLDNVHGFWLQPLKGIATAGYGYNSDIGKIINLDNMKVNNLNSALMISEDVGGHEVRTMMKESDCYVSALFAPYVLPKYFNSYDWGWRIFYGQNFGMEIDPYTAKYKIIAK